MGVVGRRSPCAMSVAAPRTRNHDAQMRQPKLSRSPLRVNGRSSHFQPKLVVDSVSEFLLAAQVSFGRLNRDVTQEKLNLFQLSSR